MFGDFDPPEYFGDDEQSIYPDDDFPLGDGRTDTSSWGVRRDPLKLSRSAQEALVAQGPRPTPGKPNIWQRIAAIGAGAAGGYINAAGRTRVDGDSAVKAIYEGDTPRRQAEWEAQNEKLRQSVGVEQADNSRRIQEYNAQTAGMAAEARQEYARQAAGMRADNLTAKQRQLEESQTFNREKLRRLGEQPKVVPGGARLVGPDNKVLVDAVPSQPTKGLAYTDMLQMPDKFPPGSPALEAAKKEHDARINRLNRVGTGAGRATPKPTQQQVLDTLTTKVIDDAVKGGASSWDHVKQNLQKHYKTDPRFTPEKRRKILAELEAQVQAGVEFPAGGGGGGLPMPQSLEGGGNLSGVSTEELLRRLK